jgi:hypothetical protein
MRMQHEMKNTQNFAQVMKLTYAALENGEQHHKLTKLHDLVVEHFRWDFCVALPLQSSLNMCCWDAQ